MFDNLLYLNGLRGLDSTGVATFRKRQAKKGKSKITYSITKAPVGSPEFLGGFKWPTDVFMALGHCRFATVGGISQMTAQPFDHENLIGIHNGTIPKYSHTGGYATDSDGFLAAISKDGIEKVIKELYFGSVATIYVGKEDHRIHAFRNSERPLAVASISGGSTLVFASEKEMIEFAAKRASQTITDLIELEKDHHYSWGVLSSVNFANHTVEKLDGPPKTNYNYSGGSTRSYGHWSNQTGGMYNDQGWPDVDDEKGWEAMGDPLPASMTRSTTTTVPAHRTHSHTTPLIGPPSQSEAEGKKKTIWTDSEQWRKISGVYMLKKSIDSILERGCSVCDKVPVCTLEQKALDEMVFSKADTGQWQFICKPCLDER